ncbi:MAG: HD domain-containing protein [Chitinophagales bacterium]|nr:HD domain-containing protein [Chitinophagales bacterium]
MNKRKIFNDPVYGFITIPHDLIYDIIDHPYFQRLRRIKQLGLTDYVYPGALHTRFHHALGALHLMRKAIFVLRAKNNEITEEEEVGVLAAILLHDVGHGPYSHTLEKSLINSVSHEDVSMILMEKLNSEFDQKLALAIEIFKGNYHKQFLHDLVSSQLDMDRMDYLNRDSFFTGVSEGVIGYDRIIEMLDVHDGQLCIESKGIYSVEKFLVARSLMYWQVYLHKTVVCVEEMLIKIIERAKTIIREGVQLQATPSLQYFLYKQIRKEDFYTNSSTIEHFVKLDDIDIFSAIKTWIECDDIVLSHLCESVVNRRLFKIIMQTKPFEDDFFKDLLSKAGNLYKIDEDQAGFFVFRGKTSTKTYNPEQTHINIIGKDGSISDIGEASEHFNVNVLSAPVTKHYLICPKEVLI